MSTKTHLFSYKECRFRVTPDKASTARLIYFIDLYIKNKYKNN